MAQRAEKSVPEGMSTVTAHLWFNGNGKEALTFYKKAFHAELTAPPAEYPDGKGVLHAMIRFGDTNLMLADAWPGQWEEGPRDHASTGFIVYVDDCDTLYNQAVNAGCEVVEPIMDAFWGDRMGKVKDPFGHCWAIASHRWIYSAEEMEENRKNWFDSQK